MRARGTRGRDIVIRRWPFTVAGSIASGALAIPISLEVHEPVARWPLCVIVGVGTGAMMVKVHRWLSMKVIIEQEWGD
jgi:hypothetical protein